MKSNIVPLLLREVTPKRVTIMEELGRGAYGKVHKGVMRELPKKEVFSKPREERVDIGEGRVVAIKVLLGEKFFYVLRYWAFTSWVQNCVNIKARNKREISKMMFSNREKNIFAF